MDFIHTVFFRELVAGFEKTFNKYKKMPRSDFYAAMSCFICYAIDSIIGNAATDKQIRLVMKDFTKMIIEARWKRRDK
jgi:hypothetical protein